MFTFGLAVVVEQEVQERFVEGDQLNVFAPLAVRTVDAPVQIFVLPVIVIVGIGLIVTNTEAVSVQPLLSLPVTVYLVVAVGVTTGLAQAVQDNVAPGVHT